MMEELIIAAVSAGYLVNCCGTALGCWIQKAPDHYLQTLGNMQNCRSEIVKYVWEIIVRMCCYSDFGCLFYGNSTRSYFTISLCLFTLQ